MKQKGQTPFKYEKQYYAVLLKTGEVVLCWPNAGLMNALDDSDRCFKTEDVSEYKPCVDCPDRPWHDFYKGKCQNCGWVPYGKAKENDHEKV